ncbi:AAA family ATPase [Glaciecola sp. MF2-115]|uniref:AAA family ATPase n=1 Tax=Glaciecola sp. MF2-115 TaxID=3384827 RepID=UPI0039A357BB
MKLKNKPNHIEYPFNISTISNLKEVEFSKSVTFFVGENGSGKSTLLEAIALKLGLNPEGGSRNFTFSTMPTHSDLFQFLGIRRTPRMCEDAFFLRAESFYNLATEIDELDQDPTAGAKIVASYGNKSLHHQSHGESFLALMVERFGANGLYLCDEPEAALSPARQLAMLSRIHQLVNEGSQLIIATHSPILLAYQDADIYEFDGEIKRVKYEETDHYQLTKLFLDNPSRFLNNL